MFVTFYFEIVVKWSKSRIFEKMNWIMCDTPGKMHMHDMVKIGTIVFEIAGGGWLFLEPHLEALVVSNAPDRIGLKSIFVKVMFCT